MINSIGSDTSYRRSFIENKGLYTYMPHLFGKIGELDSVMGNSSLIGYCEDSNRKISHFLAINHDSGYITLYDKSNLSPPVEMALTITAASCWFHDNMPPGYSVSWGKNLSPFGLGLC